MRIGVDDPPGVQNFSRCPALTPPARSSSSRSVMPSGASYWPGVVTCPLSEKMPNPVDFVGSHPGEPVRAVGHDRRHGGDRLDVVDHGGAGVQPLHRRERRLEPGLPPVALQRVEQRRLLAADVRAGPGVDDDVEVVARAEDVAAEVAGLVRLGDGVLDPPHHLQHLAADVDEGLVGLDREAGDDGALDEHVRGRQHQRDVLAGARLGFVGVHHQVVRLAVTLRDEAPFHAGGEARPAAAAQPRPLQRADDVVLRHPQRLLQRPVAALAPVALQREGVRLVPVGGEDRGEHAAHLLASLAGASLASGGGGAVQPCSLAISRPTRVAGPACGPCAARPSGKPARIREASRQVHR